MVDFQRARSAEQREARRRAILTTAAAMLGELPVADLSLNELSRRVGLAKSNVLRYFESREAVLLELLDDAAREWLDGLAAALRETVAATEPVDKRCEAVGAGTAATIAERPVLCELVAASGAVLERNVSVEVARRHKESMLDSGAALARMLCAALPELGPKGAETFTAGLFVTVAGLWPMSCPTEAVLRVYDDPRFAAFRIEYPDALRDLLTASLAGCLARWPG